jgi:CheY-like chemotaxis protein
VIAEPVSIASTQEQEYAPQTPEQIPAFVEQPAPAPVEVVAAPAPIPAKDNALGLKILLAEDNPINAMLTRELLRRRGFQIKEVTNGEAAVKAVELERFDLLLTDIHMPGMDGIEATRAIRANEAKNFREPIPIVALTADALETGKRACQDAGMDGFLTKPVDPAELDEMLDYLFPEGIGRAPAAA